MNTTNSSPIANALTIAGSDSGGGAGIQADLKTFSALGVYGASVITAITAQNTKGVTAISDVPVDVITAQMTAVFSDLDISAVKIGMLSQPSTIEAVAAALAELKGEGKVKHIVLDPVMVATSGDKLLVDQAIEVLKSQLLPLATLITPNLPEAALLLGMQELVDDQAQMLSLAQELQTLGAQNILLKGGHLASQDSVDLLYCDEALWLPAQRVATLNTHGTGCTLSSAVTAGLAKGLGLPEAVQQAKQYIQLAIISADRLTVGSGHGPVHHFHQWY